VSGLHNIQTPIESLFCQMCSSGTLISPQLTRPGHSPTRVPRRNFITKTNLVQHISLDIYFIVANIPQSNTWVFVPALESVLQEDSKLLALISQFTRKVRWTCDETTNKKGASHNSPKLPDAPLLKMCCKPAAYATKSTPPQTQKPLSVTR
jgi:hypothetical protein